MASCAPIGAEVSAPLRSQSALTAATSGATCAAGLLISAVCHRDTPVGPHPIANVLVVFKPDQFEQVVPYLMLNRDGLDVLVHPLTEDAVEDHSSYAIWLGNPVELKLNTLPRGRGGRLPSGVSA